METGESNRGDDSGYASRCTPEVMICEGKPTSFELSGADVPSSQSAVVTPQVGCELNLQLTTIRVREPDIGEAIIRVLCTGICRSDACFSLGPEPGFPMNNHISGHEAIGRIVKAHDPFLLGQPVAIRYLAKACESCDYCLRGLETSCPDQINFPKHYNGTFQQYITAPVSCLMFLPAGLLDGGEHVGKYCAALCSGSAALRALHAADSKPGDVLVVIGIAGGIGHLAGMIAKRVFGLKVIGVDRECKIDALSADRESAGVIADALLPTAEEHGHRALDFKQQLLRACMELRGDIGLQRLADIVVVAASQASAFNNLHEYVCDGGHVVCVGVPRDGDGALSISLPALVERSLRFTGSLMGGRREAMEVIRYIQSGQIKPLTTTVSLGDVPEQMQRIYEGRTLGKVIVGMP
ncbi:hypothetical protein FDECE_10643 [Fusarium decemcellulare]|nr:hypothetical protein FDECE_10643 [Fusarium decemcellulare]